MTAGPTGKSARAKSTNKLCDAYQLGEQVGHILRRAHQRHTTIFSKRMIDGLTPTRFAVLATLYKQQPLSQNELGRQTAMDIATIKGVVDRLKAAGLVIVKQDSQDKRRHHISLSNKGERTINAAIPLGIEISKETLAPLSAPEQSQLLKLLTRLT